MLRWTHVAFPSRKNTQLSVSSKLAELIFRDTGFKLNVNDCCVGSMLAYFRILMAADASTRFLPICDTCDDEIQGKINTTKQ